MTWQAWLTLGVIVGAVTTLMATRIGAGMVLLGALGVLLTAGVLTPHEALSGLSNEGLVAVGLLFVVAAGVRETGALQSLFDRWLGRPASAAAARLRLMPPVAMLSAVMNNTPVVAVLLPTVSDWAKRQGLAPSKLLIPLSYAAVLGGTCTLIGTSTNLIVNGMLLERGGAGLELFEIGLVGGPVALTGMAILWLAGDRLLPDRRAASNPLDNPREYSIEMIVAADSPLDGRTIEEAGLRHLPHVYLMEIERDDSVLVAVSSAERLRAGDRLVFVGVVDSVVELQRIRGLVPVSDEAYRLSTPRASRCLVEAVVAPSCPLVGQTIRGGRFRSVYNAAVIAVTRDGERVRQKLGDIALRAGDTLLLETHPTFADQQRNSRDFYLVSRVPGSEPPRHDRAGWAAGIVVAMIVVVAAGLLPLLTAALLAAGLMVATRCCSGAAARRSIDWQVLVVIAAALGLARAVDVSGAASALGELLGGVSGTNPWLGLTIVYGATLVLTETLTNSAAAVLMFPVALATAAGMAVSATPFVIAVMMAASASFMTPIGYQTNLMVYGPGRYRFGDYVRAGAPLSLASWALTVTLAPIFWPFVPT